ncbi:DUF2207 domain-containing protein [Paenibacillus lentus]|uniref:DUF2207 domain-containing protein n=1 Tax=Paenibacillus lentus TaxID=1338368 RepID=A0A3S8RTY0_9BACL|nr:DUF2207 domain-containing protein [Paenibacillus lentus]AZK46320.1 DUF2207 domain-containing protein [Paenibacillus lentus]
MRRWRWLWLPLVFLIILLAGCEESKKFTMEQVDVSARIMSNGDLFIQELFTYRFEGSWNGMTRYVDPEGHEGIEFFEAYIPPDGKHFADFTYDDLQRLTVDFNEKNDTYYIHTPSSNEMKRVYYRYRVKAAAIRYTDTGDLSWSFFKNNNDDIQHVTIELQLPKDDSGDRIYYFLHDRTGGEVLAKAGEDGKAYIHYYNELLDQGGTCRRIPLPAATEASPAGAAEETVEEPELFSCCDIKNLTACLSGSLSFDGDGIGTLHLLQQHLRDFRVSGY